ncbi:DEAD/DEAH box helicase [Streptomyces sp. N2A]|uniref:DEAD/DEAH box helicase n=1 Tax=Streptomyces sp. N2A TaxID=3073936 RepID=UPI002870A446|nr:DEAD/DEAH box helicase [Streptomyces sp. N2A]
MAEGQDVGETGPDQWRVALKAIAGSGDYDAGVAREAVRLCRVGLLTVREMRLILLATGDSSGWLPARRAVIDLLVADVELARQVLLLHTQVEVWPAPRFEAPDGTGSPLRVAAVVGPADSCVRGPARQGSSSREAKGHAALALLARLAGVVLPDEQQPVSGHLVVPGMVSEVFEHRLHSTVNEGGGPDAELEQEVVRRASAGRLRHRDMYLLLLVAQGEPWKPARAAALERAAAMPPTPATLLHWYGEQHGEDHGLSYEEQSDAEQRHRVRALLRADRTSRGPVRTAGTRKIARHLAACALLAELTGLPEPEPAKDTAASVPEITLPTQGQDPAKYLNKYHQKEAISKPEASVRSRGSGAECTYCCIHQATGTQVRATASGPDKSKARRAAAMALLRKLKALDGTARTSAPAPGGRIDARPGPAAVPPAIPALAPAPAVQRPRLEAQGRGAQGLLREAVIEGCAVAFVPAEAGRAAGWQVEDIGRRALPMSDLPAPVTSRIGPTGAVGWWVPLLEGIPALNQCGAEADCSAVFWHRAAHVALQLIRAQLIYPALDETGHAVWRTGPIPARADDALTALGEAAPPGAVPPEVPARQMLTLFCDALADALVRTPAAAVFGANPWTAARREPVDVEVLRSVRGWLDGVEDLVDGGPAPLLILRVQAPSDEQAAAGRMTAVLHLAPAGSGPGTEDEMVVGQMWAGTACWGGQNASAVRRRVRRVLRRAARRCPALSALAGEEDPQRCTFHAGAVAALLEQEAELAQVGVRVMWPDQLRTALTACAVIGTEAVPAKQAGGRRVLAGEQPRFSVTALLDFRWQVALSGVALTEEEMDALAEAARPLVRVRGQWVLVEPVLRRRARHRLLGELSGTQALTAALSGAVTVADDVVPCRPVGALADIIGVLRQGEHHYDAVPVPAELRATLRGYQQRALTWLARTTDLGFGAVLADDMGLGKTLTALAFTLHQQHVSPGPTLVVCPASLVTTWCREAARFAPDLPVIAYHGPDRTLERVTDTSMVITTYGLLRRDPALAARRWARVIADEAQHAKNHASATARHLRAVPATTRLALTGTPVENNLSELWALLDWANPGLFGPLKTFRARWANAAEKDPNSAEAVGLGRIISPFLLRRRKTDPGIAPELPDKIDRPHLVQLTTEQASLYEALVRETLQQVAASDGIKRHGLVFKLLTALKQITNHPAHYLREQPPAEAEAARFAARSAKTAALTELLATIRERDEAALIFTSYVTMGHLLTAHLGHLGFDPLFLHGGTPLTERQRMVDAFQSGRHSAMILSLKAAGTGLTLTRAAHVIHYDRSWNAAVEDQATDRAHRIGQHQTVTVHRLITEHTVEDRIDELLARKRALASAVLTSGDQALTQLTTRELADLVRLGDSR